PNLTDVTGLLFAQEVAAAAHIEIVAGQREAGAQIVERCEHLETLFGAQRQRALRGSREIGVSAHFRAPYPPTQLVELSQAKHVGAENNERVGAWNIETGFDDAGGKQHVVGAIVERGHDFIELTWRHLPMRRSERHLRRIAFQKIRGLTQIGDARTYEEALPA